MPGEMDNKLRLSYSKYKGWQENIAMRVISYI